MRQWFDRYSYVLKLRFNCIQYPSICPHRSYSILFAFDLQRYLSFFRVDSCSNLYLGFRFNWCIFPDIRSDCPNCFSSLCLSCPAPRATICNNSYRVQMEILSWISLLLVCLLVHQTLYISKMSNYWSNCRSWRRSSVWQLLSVCSVHFSSVTVDYSCFSLQYSLQITYLA